MSNSSFDDLTDLESVRSDSRVEDGKAEVKKGGVLETWKKEFQDNEDELLKQQLTEAKTKKNCENLKMYALFETLRKKFPEAKDTSPKLTPIVREFILAMGPEYLMELYFGDKASENKKDSEKPAVVYEEVTREATFDVEEEDSEDPKDVEIAKLQETIQKLNEEIEQIKTDDEKVSLEEESILTSMNGSWQIVSSIGMEEYLQKWDVPMSYIGAVLFQVGVQKISSNPETDLVTIRDIIGIYEHFKTELKLGEKVTVDNLTYLSFVKNNQLVTVLLRDDDKEEFARMKRFVKDGRLHVVMKRFGMSCTRIYEKVGMRPTESEEALHKRVVELEAELDHKIQNIGLLHEKVQEMIERKKKDRKELEELKEEKRELKEKLARRTSEMGVLGKELSGLVAEEKGMNEQLAEKVEELVQRMEKVEFLKEQLGQEAVELGKESSEEAAEHARNMKRYEIEERKFCQFVMVMTCIHKGTLPKNAFGDYIAIREYLGEWTIKSGHSPFGAEFVKYDINIPYHQVKESAGGIELIWDFSGKEERHQETELGPVRTYFKENKLCSVTTLEQWGTVEIERSLENRCLKIEMKLKGESYEMVFENKEEAI